MSAEIHRGPDRMKLSKGWRLIDVLAGRKAKVGDHAVGWRDDRGVAQIEARLRYRSQRLHHLGIGIPCRSEILLVRARFRLGPLDVGLRLRNLRARADGIGLGQRPLADQVDHDLAEFPAGRQVDALLLQRCLGDTDFDR